MGAMSARFCKSDMSWKGWKAPAVNHISPAQSSERLQVIGPCVTTVREAGRPFHIEVVRFVRSRQCPALQVEADYGRPKDGLGRVLSQHDLQTLAVEQASPSREPYAGVKAPNATMSSPPGPLALLVKVQDHLASCILHAPSNCTCTAAR